MKYVEAAQVHFSYRSAPPVFTNLSCDVEPGTITLLSGDNAAGKSTLIKLLCGILAPTQGVIHRHVYCATLLKNGVGFNSELSFRDNLRLLYALWRLPRKGRTQCVEQAHTAFSEIWPEHQPNISTFSAGMLCAAALELAITAARFEPKFVIFIDEVLMHLAPERKQAMLLRLRALTDQGTSLVVATHAIEHFSAENAIHWHVQRAQKNIEILSKNQDRDLS